MSSRNGGWPRLPLSAMSDRELLMVFEDACANDGGALASDVAELTDEGIRAAKAIGMRFAWLKRWGYMEQEDDKRWFLTPEGQELARVELTDAQRRQAERLARAPLALADSLGFEGEGLRMLRRQIRHRELHHQW